MPKRKRIEEVLSLAEKDFEVYKLHLHLLESLILHPTLRNKLNKSDDLQKRWTDIYSKSINAACIQLTDISRTLFVKIRKNELEHIHKPNPTDTPNFNLFVANFNAVALMVKSDILRADSAAHSVIALQRWIEMTMQMICSNDFNTAMSIYSAINAGEISKYHQYVHNRSKGFLKKLDYYFDPLKHFLVLRDHMIGQSIPNLCIFSALIVSSMENLVEKNVGLRNTVQMLLISISDMQDKYAALIDMNQKLSPDSVLFESQDMLNKRLQELAQRSKVNLPDHLDSYKLDTFLTNVSTTHFSSSPIGTNFYEANSYYEQLLNKIPRKLSNYRIEYEERIKELRCYVREMPDPGKVPDPSMSYRRKAMVDFLHSLNLVSDLRKKIQLIKELLCSNSLVVARCTVAERQLMALNPDIITKLKSLVKVLEERDSAEMIDAASAKAMRDIEALRCHQENNNVRFREITPFNRFIIVHDSLAKEVVPPLLLPSVQMEKNAKDIQRSILLDARPAVDDFIDQTDKASSIRLSDSKSADRSSSASPGSASQSSAALSQLLKISPKHRGSLRLTRPRGDGSFSSLSPNDSPAYSPIAPCSPLHSPKSYSPHSLGNDPDNYDNDFSSRCSSPLESPEENPRPQGSPLQRMPSKSKLTLLGHRSLSGGIPAPSVNKPLSSSSFSERSSSGHDSEASVTSAVSAASAAADQIQPSEGQSLSRRSRRSIDLTGLALLSNGTRNLRRLAGSADQDPTVMDNSQPKP